MAMQYGNGSNSSVGNQMLDFHFKRKALVEIVKEQYFQQMADSTAMPKNFGKKIKQQIYLPLLHDGNVNDQGIDAAGAVTTRQVTITIQLPEVVQAPNGMNQYYAVGTGASDAAALTAAKTAAENIFKKLSVFDTNYATTKTALEAAGWAVIEGSGVPYGGNLWGSSKDIGTIQGKLPLIDENGGRKNRVGFSRKDLEGTFRKFGFFDEYTKESLDFDSDAELEMHINREMLRGANEITEDVLQIDILNNAGIVRFCGDATSTAEISGEAGSESIPTYMDFVKLAISLDNNRCPKETDLITGSRKVDTKTIYGARFMHCGSEMLPTLERMKDLHGERAFIPVHKYAAAGTIARGEEGSIGKFRIIVVPEMLRWEGAGATETAANAGYQATGGKYDVFPLVVVGKGSFTTIGFQTDGKTHKFKIKHVKPESETSYGAHDPFGEKGFMSIKWYYGFMVLRPERIALLKAVAEK